MDDIRLFIETWQAPIGLAILGLMFVGFILERFPAAVVAILGACAFLFLGIINSKQLFSVFSNSAPITIGAMFILSGALLRTGTIDAIAGAIINRAARHPRLAVAEMFLGVYVASAFMNNTPVVVVMIPIILRLAQATGYSAKKLLIPLSFICILGGTTTLIGTSTNLIVDSVARANGQPAFGIFEITPYGLIAGVAGMIMLAAFSSWLLPKDEAAPAGSTGSDEVFVTELTIRNASTLRGKTLGETPIAKRAKIQVTAIKRDGRYIRHNLASEILQPDDVVVIRTDLPELMSLRKSQDFKVGIVRKGDVGPMGEVVVEAMVAPSHPSIGNRLYDIPFLSLLNVRILGLSRYRNLPRSDLPNAKIHAADKLVVTGSKADIARMYENPNLFGITNTSARAFRRDKAPLAIGALAAVVILSALNVLAIEVAAILAVGFILIARCIDAEEAWSSIDGNVLVLIFGMLAVGLALEEAGSVKMVVNALAPFLVEAPVWAVVFAVYVVSVLLTEIITNNAVAILVTPIVIKLGTDLGIDPRPLVIAVMFAASASFATPIGYQTNTLVYAAGNYRFTDFFKAGIPLTIGVGLATCFAIIALS
ncbi:MAG: sodium:sulfate symporter [Sphingomonadales bacterium RIFCSPHIGHO2_01_FULL_65_20]|uniref:SLC13 family permease n=1 Tax=unclassified Blastomonas TaxID=2626550 RepID=UPI000834434E|nr:SLC13 family permease [Blastomonas sp.]MCH2237134.1 SLC13 family permease [Blastomonas sp.]OHC92562.1 MAG: sodium:sulfate symporter [Sphingomonadales bacterium RIFCSPHIGHO2_01_FULL_65_20]